MTAFEVRLVAVPPHGALAYDERDWRDALVVVEQGAIVIEADGCRRRFERGAVLALAGLAVVALTNPGDEPALLVAASRRNPEGVR